MATKSEALGNAFAGATMAAHALTELVKLGHQDRIPELERRAIESLKASISQTDEPGVDKEACLKAATQQIAGMILMAKATAAAEIAIGLK